jgi:hypothetical protein
MCFFCCHPEYVHYLHPNIPNKSVQMDLVMDMAAQLTGVPMVATYLDGYFLHKQAIKSVKMASRLGQPGCVQLNEERTLAAAAAIARGGL